MSSLPNIKSNDQIIGAFGSKIDELSLVQNFISGIATADSAKILQATTDTLKLIVYYGDLLGKETGRAGLVADVAGLASSSNSLMSLINNNQSTTYADWSNLISSLMTVAGSASLIAAEYRKSPVFIELGLGLKAASVLVSYSALPLGNLTITEKANLVTAGRSALQTIDTATGGTASLTINSNSSSLALSQQSSDGITTSVDIVNHSDSTVVVQRLNKNLEPNETFEIYTVQSGDSLSAISLKMGGSYKALAKLNDINDPNTIYAGEQIYIESPSIS